MLEPLWQGGSNEYLQSMFKIKKKKHQENMSVE